MAQPDIAPRQKDRKLDLQQVLNDLVADRLVSQEAADKLAADRRFTRTDTHPLVVIAEQKWKDPRQPRKLLHLEALRIELADLLNVRYDPLEIVFGRIDNQIFASHK